MMVKMLLDAELRAKFNGLNEPIELCDEDGRTIGRILPADTYDDLWCAALAAETPLTREELKECLAQRGPGKPLVQLWESLGSA